MFLRRAADMKIQLRKKNIQISCVLVCLVLALTLILHNAVPESGRKRLPELPRDRLVVHRQQTHRVNPDSAAKKSTKRADLTGLPIKGADLAGFVPNKLIKGADLTGFGNRKAIKGVDLTGFVPNKPAKGADLTGFVPNIPAKGADLTGFVPNPVKSAPLTGINDTLHRVNLNDRKPAKDVDLTGFDTEDLEGKEIYNRVGGETCKERRNFVFIKTMKCATETVVRILRRFGFLRHLNFVLPRQANIYLGWPFIMNPTHYRPSDRPFNALVEHSVYNKSVMGAIMPRDAAYITIIREPFSQFKSSFNYFNVANISGVRSSDHITDYLHNIDKYESFYQSKAGSKIRYCIPDGFSVTKNLLSHCLGMPLGFPASRPDISGDNTAVHEYLHDLEKDFTLVMIMEHFHESLVLLKRLMCWSVKDIVYRTENVGNYSYKSSKASAENVDIYKRRSPVDYILYDHFNKTFWRKVQQQGPDFHEEVAFYNSIQTRVSTHCANINNASLTTLEIPASKFDASFVISPDFCLTMGMDLLTFLKARYEDEEDWVEPEHEKNRPKTTC